jgi:hypothetical protein
VPTLDYRVRDEAAGWVKPYVNVLRLTLNPEADIQRSGARGTAGQHDQASTIELIKGFESFHATPYWDYAQYSWGYGTRRHRGQLDVLRRRRRSGS